MKTIIWIDEDSDLLRSVVEPLEWAGHHVLRLHNAREVRAALEQLRSASLLLLEAELPEGSLVSAPSNGYSGLALLKELREKDHVSTSAAVLTTVHRSAVLQQLNALHLDVLEVIQKPVLPSELKESIMRILQSPTSPAA